MLKMLEVLRMQRKYNKNTVIFVNDASKVSSVYEQLSRCEFPELDALHELSQPKSLERIEKKWTAAAAPNDDLNKHGLILICQDVNLFKT